LRRTYGSGRSKLIARTIWWRIVICHALAVDTQRSLATANTEALRTLWQGLENKHFKILVESASRANIAQMRETYSLFCY